MKKLLLLAIVVLGISAVSFGQSGSLTASGYTLTGVPAEAKIIAPISIACDDAQKGISFGTIAVGIIDGTVTVASTSTGSRTYSNVTLSAINQGHSAKFIVTGEASSSFNVTLPATESVNDGASHTMTLHDFTFDGSTSNTGTSSMGTGLTTKPIYVGATIDVDSEQAAGSYAGTFQVTVNYN